MIKKIGLFFILFTIIAVDVNAQCSMCRSIAESSVSGGSQIGRGLNNGIVYMMGIPYIILLVLGVLLFRKAANNKIDSPANN